MIWFLLSLLVYEVTGYESDNAWGVSMESGAGCFIEGIDF